ncbi:hypothetical protein [Agreia sp. COWG]|uniref:hypothetical protein n=1 Tax=Agreia sp. COWG TaxID=2773266 RepID=UPI0019269C38|nr:hypothetical protein [Agreia sp. COWG]CAD5989506.1 conserved protein of unknown function [Agreia sp. COWG]
MDSTPDHLTEIDPDDEREVELADDELEVPATIDPDERVELVDDDVEAVSGDGPRL